MNELARRNQAGELETLHQSLGSLAKGSQSPTATIRLAPLRRIKRIVVAVLGGTVLALGIALIVLPGPAFLVIPAGLAILAIEFAWAKRWLDKARGWLPGKRARQTPPPCVLPSLITLPIKKP